MNDISMKVKDTADMSKSALELTSSVSADMITSNTKMEEMSQAMEEIVERSNEISKIIKTIDDIAFQTNILSLNAAIEAARAGSAGKGFAVVADEISKLAANSRQTAATIQDIAVEVTEAVQALASNAKEVLDFINGTVIGDYDEFVDTGEKYGHTAEVMNEMLSEFTEKADSLNVIMKDMVESVNTITNSVQESSQAINMSAENSTEIVTGI